LREKGKSFKNLIRHLSNNNYSIRIINLLPKNVAEEYRKEFNKIIIEKIKRRRPLQN